MKYTHFITKFEMEKKLCIIVIYSYFCVIKCYELDPIEIDSIKNMSSQQLKNYFRTWYDKAFIKGHETGFKTGREIGKHCGYQEAVEEGKKPNVYSEFYCAINHLRNVEECAKRIVKSHVKGFNHPKEGNWTGSPIERIFTHLNKKDFCSVGEKWHQRYINTSKHDALQWKSFMEVSKSYEDGLANSIREYLLYDDHIKIFYETNSACHQVFNDLLHATLTNKDNLRKKYFLSGTIDDIVSKDTTTLKEEPSATLNEFRDIVLKEHNYRLRQEDLDMALVLREILLDHNKLIPIHKKFKVRFFEIGKDDENQPIVIPLYAEKTSCTE